MSETPHDTVASAMAGRSVSTALVLVDLQLDYFPGGAFPLVNPEAAVAAAGAVLDRFRLQGDPVVHVRHVWDDEEATFMRPETPGVEIHPRVAPRDGEPVVTKAFPNSFRQTTLAEELAKVDAAELVVVGMMSSLCVDSTVRAAADLGYSVTVIEDACAAPDLAFGGVDVPGASVHAAFMAALADSYATVVASADFVSAG